METSLPQDKLFNKNYSKHLKCLKLAGYQPKTIEAYARAIRRVGNYFSCRLDNLTTDQLLDYFHDLLQSHSWNTVKLDLYGLQFFYKNVLQKAWDHIPLIKQPKVTRIPDILTTKQINQLLASTKVMDYRGLFLYGIQYGAAAQRRYQPEGRRHRR